MQKLNPSDQTCLLIQWQGGGGPWLQLAGLDSGSVATQTVLATAMIQPTLSLRFKPSETAEQIFRAPNLPFLLQGRGDNA